MGQIEIVEDYKTKSEFWLNALTYPNLNDETIELINRCLQAELNNYLYPFGGGE